METAPWQLRRAALPVPTTDRNPEIGGDPGPHILPPIRQFGCRPADGLRIVEHVARTELDLVPVGSFDRIPAPLDEVLTACGYLKAAGNGRRPRMYSEVEAGRSATVCVGVRANAKAATKLIYLALRNITAKWKKPPKEWHAAKAQFAIQFGDRFALTV